MRYTQYEDIGYGGGKSIKSGGDSLEGAMKEGATDALKRALYYFGEALGNCLYYKLYCDWLEGMCKREGELDLKKRYSEKELLCRLIDATSSGKLNRILVPGHVLEPAVMLDEDEFALEVDF